jgi:hypothetical protein
MAADGDAFCCCLCEPFITDDLLLKPEGVSLQFRGRVPRSYFHQKQAMTIKLKSIEQLVQLSSMRYRTSTCCLSTWWSSTALKRDLVLRGASRLDAFSGYPFRT